MISSYVKLPSQTEYLWWSHVYCSCMEISLSREWMLDHERDDTVLGGINIQNLEFHFFIIVTYGRERMLKIALNVGADWKCLLPQLSVLLSLFIFASCNHFIFLPFYAPFSLLCVLIFLFLRLCSKAHCLWSHYWLRLLLVQWQNEWAAFNLLLLIGKKEE